MQGAELVAVRIAQIGEIEAAKRGLTHAGWRLSRCSTVGDPGGMPEIDLPGRLTSKADCSAIGSGRRPTVERLRDNEKPLVAAIDIASTLIVVITETVTIADRA